MKSGETWIVSADRVDPIGSLGLSFLLDGFSVAGAAYGTFTDWEEIDSDTEMACHIQRQPAPKDTGSSPVQVQLVAHLIRRLPSADEYARKSPPGDSVGKLLAVLRAEQGWTALQKARGDYKATYGGFPPITYKAFNEAVARAVELGLIETTIGA